MARVYFHRTFLVSNFLTAFFALGGAAVAVADPGDIHRLESRELVFQGPRSFEAVERAMNENLYDSLRGFVPRVPQDEAGLIKVGKGRFRSSGPRGAPRIEFDASVGAAFVNLDISVRGDVDVQPASCSRPGEQGKRILLDLQDSAEAVLDNARSFEVTLCWSRLENGGARIRASSSFVEGEDFGVIAGPKTIKVLKAQTEPMVRAFSNQINIIQAALVAEEVRKTAIEFVSPPCGNCEVR